MNDNSAEWPPLGQRCLQLSWPFLFELLLSIVYMWLRIELRGRVVEDGLFQDLRDQGGSAIYQRTSLVTPPISSCIGGNQGYKVNTAHELVLA